MLFHEGFCFVFLNKSLAFCPNVLIRMYDSSFYRIFRVSEQESQQQQAASSPSLGAEALPKVSSIPNGKRPLLPYIFVLIFLLSLLPAPLFFVGLLAPSSNTEPVKIIIPRGTSVQEITKILDQKGVLVHPLLFRAASRLLAEDNLKAGEYELGVGLSVMDIAALLRDGQSVRRQFTVPEGLSSHEIVSLLGGVEGLSGNVGAVPEEGTLMPETYVYAWDNNRAEIVKRMQEAQRKVLADLWVKRQEGLPLRDEQEALILASIVEKETGLKAEERGRVAGVFINRLKRGMPLQSDPTVIYALTEGKGPLGRALLYKDLKVDSPYNTYQNAGLPPKPICNPGRAAIEAVLQPEKNNYIYFVADGTGGHAFARTLREHNKNVANWKRVRRP